MKCLYSILIATFVTTGVAAQEVSSLPGANCDSLGFMYSNALIDHYSAYNDDSLQQVISAWEEACGINEPLLSFKVLYSIGKGTFSESLYGGNITQWLLEYRENSKGHEDMPDVPADYYFYLREIAMSLKSMELTPVEKTLVDYYEKADDEILNRMDSSSLAGTGLYADYTAYKKEMERIYGRFQMAVIAGIWIPDGNINTLGSHPLIGFQVGSSWAKVFLDLELSVRFLNAPDKYKTVYQGALYETKHYSAIFVGANAGFKFLEKDRHQLSMLVGAGYDNTSVVTGSADDASDGKSLSSANINGGLGYRFYFSKDQYIGLAGKYNLLFYRNRGGTNLSGNAVTITLAYGFH